MNTSIARHLKNRTATILGRAALLLALSGARATSLEDWAKMEPIVPCHYVCQRATSPVAVDGRLDDKAWQAAPWTEDFVDIEGDAKPRPKFRTRAKLLWDDDYLYIAAELEEPDVWGTLTKHDSVIFRDPDFEVFLNPDGSSHEYYEFEMNALNTGWDLYLSKPYKDGGKAEDDWDIPGLKTAVHVRGTLNRPGDKDEGWTLEIAFPWKGFSRHTNRRGLAPRDGDQWRLGFSRVEWQVNVSAGAYQKVPGTVENNWIWSPQGIVDMHRPEKWGYLQFTSSPATAQFHPDETATARSALQRIYNAQRDFQKEKGRWAKSLAELGVGDLNAGNRFEHLDLQGSANGFTATAVLKDKAGKTRRVHIRQDSKVWED
ncbi:MAG TPA: carbohydrate-binding family 9-like protein [Verrucomicrobiae bacterium]|nr:carbohydrate-binding family 9-like protein [Verrucomicrobiae bacterium]